MLVGKRSFGNASIRSITLLPNDSSMKFAVARWFPPKGQSIEHAGIEPDVISSDGGVEFGSPEDLSLFKALALLRRAS